MVTTFVDYISRCDIRAFMTARIAAEDSLPFSYFFPAHIATSNEIDA